MPEPGLAIEARALTKRFKEVTALDGFELAVPDGTVHGLLGPNGAGKTTAVRVLTTLLRPDGGRARGRRASTWRATPQEVRRRIGLAGQYAAVDEILTGRQNLEMFGRLFHLGPEAGGAAGRRAAGAVRPRRRRRQGRQAVQRRHAPAARPGGEHDPGPAGAVPRRADDRARPARPQRGVGRGPRAGGGRHDGAADHAVPGGGRPARRPDHGHRPRPGRRRRHPGPSSRARSAATRSRWWPRRGRPGGGGRGVRRRGRQRAGGATPSSATGHRAGRRPGRGAERRWPAGARPSGSRSRTSRCAGRPWTTCSCG